MPHFTPPQPSTSLGCAMAQTAVKMSPTKAAREIRLLSIRFRLQYGKPGGEVKAGAWRENSMISRPHRIPLWQFPKKVVLYRQI
jgi:hypothetical protein